MKDEKDLNYYKGYAQGYKDAIRDLKGWTPCAPYITWTLPTQIGDSTPYTTWKENWVGGSPTTTTITTDGNWSFDAITKLTPEEVQRIFSYKGD